MENSRKFIGIISISIVLIISILIFYLILIQPNLFNDLVIMGITSIIFSIIAYLFHSLISSKNIVSLFVWGYYALGMFTLVYDTLFVKLDILYLVFVLFFILISLVFIYWRLKNVKS